MMNYDFPITFFKVQAKHVIIHVDRPCEVNFTTFNVILAQQSITCAKAGKYQILITDIAKDYEIEADTGEGVAIRIGGGKFADNV